MRSTARCASATRNAQVGPEPETTAPSAPYSRPAARVLRSSGRSDTAAGWSSLLSSGPTWAGSPDRSADMSSVLSLGGAAVMSRAALIRSHAR